MKNEKTPMSYTKKAFIKLGVPCQWYGSGGGYEHYVISPNRNDWSESPHLMTGGNIDGSLVWQCDWEADYSLHFHLGFGYDWEELSPKKMKAIAKEIAYTAQGWLLCEMLQEATKSRQILNETKANK
jgi:hypothetical protein